jgi:predicted outer membrane repeat protein
MSRPLAHPDATIVPFDAGGIKTHAPVAATAFLHISCTFRIYIRQRIHIRSARMPLRLHLRPLAAAVTLCLTGSIHAANIVVTNANEGSVTGQCTVQDAVTAVNTQTAINACVAGDGSNDNIDLTGFTSPTTITFTASTATIGADNTVALGLTRAATIVGALDASGNPVVTLKRSSVSGTPNFGILASTANLYINGLAIENGHAAHNGGAVYVGGTGTLSLSHCAMSDNYANAGGAVLANNSLTAFDCSMTSNNAVDGGALSVDGTATLSDVTVSGNSAMRIGGGALLVQAATITGSTFSNNSALGGSASSGYGGGLFTVIAPTLSNTTISGNSATKNGGGIFAQRGMTATGCVFNGNSADAHGGAIATESNGYTATLINSTVSGNTASGAGGGIWAYAASLSFATVYANRYTTPGSKGAGLYFIHGATAYASILTGNGNYDIGAPSNIAVSGSYNIVGAGVSVPPDTRNCAVDFGPLANFGGPTKTLPLLTGSCAIDSGPFNATATVTDQRGDPRPIQITGASARWDVGAFEKQSASDPDYIFIDGFGNTGSD